MIKLSPVGPQAADHLPAETVGLEVMVGKVGVLAWTAYLLQTSRKGSLGDKFR